MCKQKDGNDEKAQMKSKRNNGEKRLHSPVGAGKGDDPVNDGAKRIIGTPISVYHGILLFCQFGHGYESIQTSPDKNNEGDPNEGAGHKRVDIMHSKSP
jgi:hypothetical protein